MPASTPCCRVLLTRKEGGANAPYPCAGAKVGDQQRGRLAGRRTQDPRKAYSAPVPGSAPSSQFRQTRTAGRCTHSVSLGRCQGRRPAAGSAGWKEDAGRSDCVLSACTKVGAHQPGELAGMRSQDAGRAYSAPVRGSAPSSRFRLTRTGSGCTRSVSLRRCQGRRPAAGSAGWKGDAGRSDSLLSACARVGAQQRRLADADGKGVQMRRIPAPVPRSAPSSRV